MRAYRAVFTGHWGHFRRPEANNNPITFDFIPKTAFIGMIGAVAGLTRTELKKNYKDLCKTIFYNVQIKNPISKIATNFRIYKYKGSLSSVGNPPQFYELLQDPSFRITFFGENDILKKFIVYLKNKKSIYTPTFGLANCPVDITSFEEVDIKKTSNIPLKTHGFIPFKCRPKVNSNVTLSFDDIPVVQNDNWFNIRYERVFYGYFPDKETIEVGESNYENQYTDNRYGYFFI